MLTKEWVQQYLGAVKETKSDATIDKHLSKDQSARKQSKVDSLEFVVWDKKSPVNGASAEYMLNRSDVKAANPKEIYLIKEKSTGQVRYFQYHHPFLPGIVPLTKANVKKVAKEHVENLAEAMASQEILREMLADAD